jgi:hypothetical protein
MASDTSPILPRAAERPLISRRRTAFACEACRIKKTKCDGQNPCSKCRENGSDCLFATESQSTKAKSEVILSAILRLETSLGQLHERVAAFSRTSPGGLIATSLDSPESDLRLQNQSGIQSTNSANGVDNAVISESHSSTTESILRWPIFDAVPGLRVEQTSSIFTLENLRQNIPVRRLVHPYTSPQDADRLLHSFQRTVNFVYPVVSLKDLTECRSRVVSGEMDDSLASCLALLVMALGCAAEVTFRSLSSVYFDAAIRQIHNAYMEISTRSAQSLMLAAIFYAYLQRPLQAWSMLGAAATKCRVLLSYGTANTEDSECVSEVSWLACSKTSSAFLRPSRLSMIGHIIPLQVY